MKAAPATAPSPSFLGTRATRFAVLAVAVAASIYQYAYYCPGLDTIRGSVVIITGSSSGIGEELAYQYGALGARIVLAARRASELERVAEGARAKGAQDVLVVPTDMSNGPACEALVAAAVAKFGRLDTVILNHASVDDQLFLTHEGSKSIDDQILFLMKVNVLGSAYVARAAIPHLERTGGHIAVTSSGTAKIAAPFHAGYVASKRALHGLFDTIRHELKLLGRWVTYGGRAAVRDEGPSTGHASEAPHPPLFLNLHPPLPLMLSYFPQQGDNRHPGPWHDRDR
jgi:NADP-dependent 3-hydroxy acid dehydrogenase YdfG